MRRFFSAQRDQDYGQIQYLTAQCARLAHDKATQEREILMCRESERALQINVQMLAAQLFQQEQVNKELQVNQGRLVCRIHRQQDLVAELQQRLVSVAQENSQDMELLLQVRSELLSLQSSEVKLEDLVEELHTEAHGRAELAHSLLAELQEEALCWASKTEGLEAELRRKTSQLDELQVINVNLMEELEELRGSHERQVRTLQQENQVSLKKLQQTVEQFEWLCEQQRVWICCIKRFKKHLLEERDSLLQQVNRLKEQTNSDDVEVRCRRCRSQRNPFLKPPDATKSLVTGTATESLPSAPHLPPSPESHQQQPKASLRHQRLL